MTRMPISDTPLKQIYTWRRVRFQLVGWHRMRSLEGVRKCHHQSPEDYQVPPTERRRFGASPVRGIRIGYIKQEKSVSQEPVSEWEAQRPSEYSYATFPTQSKLTFAQLLLASSPKGLGL